MTPPMRSACGADASRRCWNAAAPAATRRRRSAAPPNAVRDRPEAELRELSDAGPPEGPARRRRQHGPRDHAGARRRGARVPRPARGRGRARRRGRRAESGPRSGGTCTCTPTGPTAARPSRRWPARPSSSATSTSRSRTTRPSSPSRTASRPTGCVKQLDVVAELNEELAPFRILTGIEVDILEDGALDQERDLLAELDVVVASVHSKLRMKRDEMTQRMITRAREPARRHPRPLHRPDGARQGSTGVRVRPRARVRGGRAPRQGGRDQLPARAARPADAAAEARWSTPAARCRSTPTPTPSASSSGSPTGAPGPPTPGSRSSGSSTRGRPTSCWRGRPRTRREGGPGHTDATRSSRNRIAAPAGSRTNGV